MSIIYSLAGAVVSLLAMVLVKKMDGISIVGVSITGGVFHNIGQILVALAVVENLKLIYYTCFLKFCLALNSYIF